MGLERPGIQSRWKRCFPHPSTPAVEPTQPSVQWAPDLFQGAKRPERGFNHPFPYSAEVKESVELCFYSSLWQFMACSMVKYF